MQVPPFCPQRGCPNHWITDTQGPRWWRNAGHYHCRREGIVQRFQCRTCRHRFSESSFSVHYFAKRKVSYNRLVTLMVSATGVRAAARILHISPGAVTGRITRLARQAIALQAQMLSSIVFGESLVADGLESFWVSQYCPNNFNILVGTTSQFVYAMNAATLRRSGRMRAAQRATRERLEQIDRAEPGALLLRFTELLQSAGSLWSQVAPARRILLTDRHPLYPIACSQVAVNGITHRRVSSKAPRTRHNPLFSVNYIDREIRKDLAEHHRETVCFARNASLSLHRMWIYLVHHNYCKPFRVSPPSSTSHAERAGLPTLVLRKALRHWLTRRVFLSKTWMSQSQLRSWMAMEHTPFSPDSINPRLTPAHCYA